MIIELIQKSLETAKQTGTPQILKIPTGTAKRVITICVSPADDLEAVILHGMQFHGREMATLVCGELLTATSSPNEVTRLREALRDLNDKKEDLEHRLTKEEMRNQELLDMMASLS